MKRAVALTRFVREGVAASFGLAPKSYLEFLRLCREDLKREIDDVLDEVSKIDP